MEKDKEPIICIPGQRLCLSDKINIPGPGTYEQHGYIYSKLAGTVELVKDEKTTTIVVHGITEQSIVPAPGDIVTAMVIQVNQRFCKCIMKCIGDVVLTRPYRGNLRKEDVRATEKDRVELYKSFRPGDIILARVLGQSWEQSDATSNEDRDESLNKHINSIYTNFASFLYYYQLPMTEAHVYQLSTAENELGVVVAHSESGIALVPISWTEMQCPKTLVKEFRKVAKVVPEQVIMEQ